MTCEQSRCFAISTKIPNYNHYCAQVNRLEITFDKSLIAAAGNPQIRLYDVASNNPQPVMTYDGHTGNVTSIGFQRDRYYF